MKTARPQHVSSYLLAHSLVALSLFSLSATASLKRDMSSHKPLTAPPRSQTVQILHAEQQHGQQLQHQQQGEEHSTSEEGDIDLDRVSYWVDHPSGKGKHRVLREGVNVPTQFEVAMTHTLHAVKAGLAPDPEMRRPDGTPGTLLEALVEDTLTPEAREHHRLKLREMLQYAASWRFFGANIPFLEGPTLADLNVSYYRYASVDPLRTPSVDWRKTMYMTPVQAQYDCASCWAMAAADTVALATAIASNRPGIGPGVQHLCDCSGMECCQGGWPEDAFAWMTSQGNITTSANYNYWASDDRNCTLEGGYPTAGNISGWEEVPSHSLLDLMKAVSMQPVLVYVAASSADFQAYWSTAPGTMGFNIYNGNCSNEVNHAMVAVGYDITGNYWILKNTWLATGWGHNGYMYITMEDGPGKCGMLSVAPVFPTYFSKSPVQATVRVKNAALSQMLSRYTFPVLASSNYWWTYWTAASNPCVGLVNPCGAGLCYNSNGIARCLCPAGYVEIVNAPTSKCLDPTPCSSSLFNPCGAGTCQNVGDGTYFCLCPLGYKIGAIVNGAPTCIAITESTASANTYVTQYGDTCAGIQSAYGIDITTFSSLNPFIICDSLLLPGIVLLLPPASSSHCTAQYAMRPSERCSQIAFLLDKYPQLFFSSPNSLFSINPPASYPPTSLLSLNPRLNCSSLFAYQVVCVNASVVASAEPITCGLTYSTVARDTCSIVAGKFGLNATYFRRLNPGINCNFNLGVFPRGNQLCVASADVALTLDISCTSWYTVQQGDSCARIWNAANISQFQLQYINPGLQCLAPFLFVGQQICIDSPALSNIADPGYLLYTVRPKDTWSIVQAQFTSRCRASSITIDRIAAQNGIEDWSTATLTADMILVIPCVAKIGATCGCAPSLPVCGADLVNYNSYCDARCNFATPVASEPCTSCQNACSGRYGRSPKPKSACPNDYICPWPQWPPSLSDATAVFTLSPLCSYRTQTCVRVCSIVKFQDTGNTGYDASCYNTCMACNRVPCSGPSQVMVVGTGLCPTCPRYTTDPSATRGCLYQTVRTCSTDCSYWNSLWNPLNP